ncbi:Cell surface glycoprotein [ANME-1 cluster archaeon GoMg1]|nr:Cell surface glycoprotein [ANME-1 cluster archaeon GoMg1]
MRMKKVIGVAAVIMIIMAIVLIAFSSTITAKAVDRTFTKEGGNITYREELPYDADAETKTITVYEGERIKFVNNETGNSVDVTVSGPYNHEGDKKSGCADYSVKKNESWDSEGMKTGYFFKVYDAEGDGCWFSVDKQSFSLKLVDDIDKVQEKASFNLSLKTNNKKEGVMKLTIEDSDGYSIMNDISQDIYEVLVDYTEVGGKPKFTSDPVDANGNLVEGITNNTAGELVFNTTRLDMRKGTYKIILEDYATEVEEDVTITVEKWYLEMECADEVVKDWEDIVITIQSSFYKKDVNVTVEDIPKWTERTLTLDEEGKKRVRISTENVDYGRYKVTVEVVEFPECAENRYVLIKKGKMTLEVLKKKIATVGDIVHIEGTSDYGYLAVFVIDDVYKADAAIVDDEFEWYWDTGGELDGYYGIKVFIVDDRPDPEEISIDGEVPENWQSEEGVDASSSIILNSPAFNMTVSKCIAKSDPVVISGTATGADHVYVIVFNYRGEVMFPYTENRSPAPANATFVEEGKWTKTLSARDFGDYTVIALDKGEDGRTRAIKNGKWEIGGESKTLEQRVAYLMDAITFVGSDDLYVKACFSVSAPEVILTVPETVEIGTAISVNAKTNIREGEKAFISLSQNSSIIKKNSPEVKNGSVTASIDTSGLRLLPGKYNVAVDISGRASDEKEVVLVEKGKEPIPKNESLTEPASEAVKEGNETVGEGEFLNETGDGWEEVQKKIPVNMCDLIIAVVVASAILAVARRRRR